MVMSPPTTEKAKSPIFTGTCNLGVKILALWVTPEAPRLVRKIFKLIDFAAIRGVWNNGVSPEFRFRAALGY